MRIKEATSTSLATFLDTAIFFSLTLQFAGLLWLLQTEKYLTADNGCTFYYAYNMVGSDYPCRTSSSDENISGKSGYAGHLYNTLLLLYTCLVTMCPLVTLANTPYFWQDIRRREFRLLAMILILVIGGVVNSYWTKAYNRNYEIDKVTNNTFPNAVYHASDSCIAEFIFAVLPSNTEAKILRFSYALCASVLLLCVIVQWRRSCSELISGWCQLLVRVFGSKASADPPGSRYEHPDTRPSREGRTDMESQTFLSRPTDLWSKRIPRYSRKLLFALVYIINPILPLLLLIRVGWIRGHIRAILHAPTPENTFYPLIQNVTYLREIVSKPDFPEFIAETHWATLEYNSDWYREDWDYPIANVFTTESDLWDGDKWSFGQILSLSLWFPAFLELFYILIGIAIPHSSSWFSNCVTSAELTLFRMKLDQSTALQVDSSNRG